MTEPVGTQPAPTATEPTATPAPDAELATLRQRVAELQTREGRFRNEKGVMQARIRELEQLALGNQTEVPEYGQPSFTPPQPQFGQQPQYQPLQPPIQPDMVTREEFDLDRIRRELPKERFDACWQKAQSAEVRNYIRYRPNPYGQAVPDVYATYKAISDALELEELRKQQAQASPNRNPALGTISGSGASSAPDQIDVSELTPEQMREKFPEAFSPTNLPWGNSR